MKARKLMQKLVGAPGFEPGTSCAQGKRATRLRHAPRRAGVRSQEFGVESLVSYPQADAISPCHGAPVLAPNLASSA